MELLNLRTEYSYRAAFGRIRNVISKTKSFDGATAGICDRNGTWGHVVWDKECRAKGIKPIFGVELAVVNDASIKEKQSPCFMSFIAINNSGLQEIYQLVTKSTKNFYYIPRIDYNDIKSISKDVAIFIGLSPNPELIKDCPNVRLDLKPTTPKNTIRLASDIGADSYAMNDNFYIDVDDRDAYEISIGRFKNRRTIPMHIMDEGEWIHYCGASTKSIENTKMLAELCDVQLPKAKMVTFPCNKTISELCYDRAKTKGIDLSDKKYDHRLNRELDLIKEKDFENYFYVIWDLVKFAKSRMLVGPGRGSSCGSLVCYLLDITEIDPIPYDLLFERFIDVNRADMPDIDIDFPDSKRDLVFDYLKEKYGESKVARLGSVNKFQARSAIGIAAKEMDIAPWDVKDLKDSLIERFSGHERAEQCIQDTFLELDCGKKAIEKYPHLCVAERMESHASHAGQHAAGIVVTAHPVSNYCSIDDQTGAAQIDKHDAESLDLLKIDALGLRTLSVIEDCLEQIGWEYEKILECPRDNKSAFDVINDKKYASIFQFEGDSLKSVCENLTIESFNDVAAITALARPGPLSSGGAQMYIDRKNGDEPVHYLHDCLEPILNDTYGVFVYQEQVMRVVREIGGLSWAKTSKIRKAMSKSLGEDFFNTFKTEFIEGAFRICSVPENIASKIFDEICTFGAWGFNKSHAIAYGLVSYWCMVLKSQYPLEWAVAGLRNCGTGQGGQDRCIKLLRELDREGITYRPYDAIHSLENWSYSDGVIIGGLTNIKGVGAKVAKDIIRRRNAEEEFTPRQSKLLLNGETPFDVLYEGKEIFGHILDDPISHNIVSKIHNLGDLNDDDEGDFLVIAKILTKSLRDENEQINIEKRKTRAAERGEDIGDGIIHGQTSYLNCKIEDDSEKVFYARISRSDYRKFGKPIMEKHKENDWFLWKGRKIKGINMLFITRHKFIGNKELGCII